MQTLKDLPSEVADYLTQCPAAGTGVNNFVYRATLRLLAAGVPEADIPALIEAATRNCGRALKDDEIDRAIANGVRYLTGENRTEKRTPDWPDANLKRIQEIARSGPSLRALKELSPVKCADGKPGTDEVLDHLFPGNPLLCIGTSKYEFYTRPREAWRGRMALCQFIVPSPMSSITGLTTEGKVSEHTKANTGPRRFLVIEFDPPKWEDLLIAEQAQFGTESVYYDSKRDEHAAILAHLSKFAPFVLAGHSAGKSIHGWFDVQGWPEPETQNFFRYAVSLGADKQLWIPSQFVRLPGGFRPDKQKRQAVIYYNPSLVYGQQNRNINPRPG